MANLGSSRQFFRRVALVVFGLVLSMVILELGLRLAAGFVGPRTVPSVQEVDPSGQDNALTILTLGDSHTYGIFLPPDEAYPGQLQTLLDVRAQGRYRVINLGLPGMNSSEIAAKLPDWVSRYRPHAIIVCVGINNMWNETRLWNETELEEKDWLTHMFSDLRIVRLWSLLKINLQSATNTYSDANTNPEIKQGVEHRDRETDSDANTRPEIKRVLIDGGKQGVEHRDKETGELLIRHSGNIHKRALNIREAALLLQKDLNSIWKLSREHESQLILLTYAAPSSTQKHRFRVHDALNGVIRRFSKSHFLALVDTHDRFSRLFKNNPPRKQYFNSETDDHPNSRGYHEIAVLVADVLEPGIDKLTGTAW